MCHPHPREEVAAAEAPPEGFRCLEKELRGGSWQEGRQAGKAMGLPVGTMGYSAVHSWSTFNLGKILGEVLGQGHEAKQAGALGARQPGKPVCPIPRTQEKAKVPLSATYTKQRRSCWDKLMAPLPGR